MDIKKFTDRYQVSKTLRFKLIPEGKTMENFLKDRVLDSDKEREKYFKDVKKIIDEYHIAFIDEVLSKYKIKDIEKYAKLFYIKNKTEEEKEELSEMEKSYRKDISEAFTKNDKYEKIFGDDLIKELLPEYLKDKEKIEKVKKFENSTTYFTGFNRNRKNMYTGEGNSTEIAYRIIDDNLPRYLKNISKWETLKKNINEQEYNNLAKNCKDNFGINVETYFTVNSFNSVLRQRDIEKYNSIIGGFSVSGDVKIKGLNEFINEYNQKNGTKFISLDFLYKQVLSDANSDSFAYEPFTTDKQIIDAIDELNNVGTNNINIYNAIDKLRAVFSKNNTLKVDSIFVKSKYINELSAKSLGDWSIFSNAIKKEYDEQSKDKDKSSEKYFEKRNNDLKKVAYYSLQKLQEFICDNNTKIDLIDYFLEYIDKQDEVVKNALKKFNNLKEKAGDKTIAKNEDLLSSIKDLLDSLMEVNAFIEIFEADLYQTQDDFFYSELDTVKYNFSGLNALYNRVRNYVTKKPYSTSKIQITLNNPQLLDGWDINKEKDYMSTILRKDNYVYLALLNDKKAFSSYHQLESDKEYYEKMIYKLLPSPSKMLPKVCLSKKGKETFKPSSDILKVYDDGTFKKGNLFNLDDCHKLIDYYKKCIAEYDSWKSFDFSFKETSEYNNISEFYKDVEDQGYKITFDRIPSKYIDELVEEDKIYLFKIYNKDFSKYSKGNKNLHTLYFNALFDEDNLKDVVIKMNGKAELFYREASLKKEETTIHKAGDKLKNKNPLNKKEYSQFDYDIIKDKRFTNYHFQFHLPIVLNFKSNASTNLNLDVRSELRMSDNTYIIGIDRGERNLIYISVIDSTGKIVEQTSFNIISNSFNGTKIETNYHDILDEREKNIGIQRKEWKTIENIKEIKEGYISQIVHKIVTWVEKYNAVIGMEDLSSGFKNSRKHIDKQIYQKFEKMLIDKLNYCVNKNSDKNEPGGLYNAYQLTNRFESFEKMGKQNGIIFYVPAWHTSKIDPTTGFVNLLNTKYESVAKSKEFVEKIDSIKFDEKENAFTFEIDYTKFERGSMDYRKHWLIYSNGERIKTFRNKEKNNSWDNERICLTKEFKSLFDKYSINIETDIKKQILNLDEKDFFVSFMKLMSLTLQLRNSEIGGNVDYLISPVKNKDGKFFFSDDYKDSKTLPCDADANGAYHIALKTLWAVEQIKNCNDEELGKVKLAIKNSEWLEFVQKRNK